MKSLFSKFLAVVILSSILFSCGSDDGDGIDQNLFATWTLTTTIFSECANPNLNETRAEECNDRVCEQFTFNQDNTYSRVIRASGQETTVSGTFEVRGNQIQVSPTGGTPEVFEFVVTGTSLSLTRDVTVCTQETVYSK